jgi:hypothetical protein
MNCPEVDAAVEAAYIADMISYLRSKGYTVLHPDLKSPNEVADSWRANPDRSGGQFTIEEELESMVWR